MPVSADKFGSQQGEDLVSNFSRFHVVLVEPEESLNVGMTARAMMNLGFSRLHLVAPRHYNPRRAARTACWARELLMRAEVHVSLQDALSSMQEVVGLTMLQGRRRLNHMLLPQWLLEAGGEPAAETALVFGPERTGLRREHLELCTTLVRIPSSAHNPSYNLAQAVLLVLFEISRAAWGKCPSPRPSEAVTWNEYYQLDRKLDYILEVSGFNREKAPSMQAQVIKNLMRRIKPDRREMGILLAMFDKITGALRRKR